MLKLSEEKRRDILIVLNDIKTEEIPNEIYEIESEFSPKQISNISMTFDNFNNYLTIMYYIVFMKKLTKSEAAFFFGIKPSSFAHRLYNLGWNYSQDWEENKRLLNENKLKALNQREFAKMIKLEENFELKDIVDKANRYTNNTRFTFFKDEEEYLKVIAYYLYIKKISIKEVQPIMGEPLSTVQTRLRKFGLNFSFEDGIKRKKDRKTQDYIKTKKSSQQTTLNKQVNSLSTGSEKEIYSREFLSIHIYEFFPLNQYDSIVGCSNTGILGSEEIDIPIIIYNIEKNILNRICFEYNGERYHNEEKDNEKEERAKKRGWNYVRLVDRGCDFSNNKEKLNDELYNMLKKIKYIVNSNE